MHTNPYFISRVVGTLVALCVSPIALGQAQRPTALTNPQPYLPEPLQRLSEPAASGGSGSETVGTTPILFESAKLTASDAGPSHNFGNSVSVSGETAIVGTPHSRCPGIGSCGSVHVFRVNGDRWIEELKLTMVGNSFGGSTSVNGNIAVVGSVYYRCPAGGICGAVNVYRYDGVEWFEEQKLIASDAAEFDSFGTSVSVYEDAIVIGSPGDDCAVGYGCGAAYVFRFNGTEWVEEQKLIASDASAHDFLGHSVSLNGNTAVVSAPESSYSAGAGYGSAYVFRFDGTTWIEEQRLRASDAAERERFGSSVAVSGDAFVVGKYGRQCPEGSSCASAYIFRFNGVEWIEEQKLTASDGAAAYWFGQSVSLNQNTAVIGSVGNDCAQGLACGAAYVFRFNGIRWVEGQKLVASDGATNDMLGTSVSVNENRAVVGAPVNNCQSGWDCGAVYVFDLPPPPLQIIIDIKPGNDINPVNLGARGVLSVAVLTTSVADGDLIDFDAVDVDPSSLTLAGAAPHTKGRSGRVGSLADIDGDGDFDLLVHFPIAELELELPSDGSCPPDAPAPPGGGPCPPYSVEAVLLGQTFDGTPIRSIDTITAIQAQRIGAESLRRAE